jgi:hypothetical protein
MNVFALIMYALALICFLVSAFSTNPPRVNLLALGLAFFTLPALAATADAVL